MRLLKLVPDNTNIGFVRLRYWAFGLTMALTILSVVLTVTRGLNMGVDFVGGVMIEAKLAQPPQLDKLRGPLDALHVGDVSLQQFGGRPSGAVRLPLPNSSDEGASNALIATVKRSLQQNYPGVALNKAD